MKKLAVVAIAALSSLSCFAAPIEVIQQVISDQKVVETLEGTSVTGIEETATFRCLGCYRFEITTRTPVGVQRLTIGTRAIGQSQLEVTILEATK